jgi:hypothetical protein
MSRKHRRYSADRKLLRNARKFRRGLAGFIFYLVAGLQIEAATPVFADLLTDQPGGVRQCARKMTGGKEDRMARTWHCKMIENRKAGSAPGD